MNLKSTELSTVDINYTAVLPEIILSLFGILIMILIPFTPKARQSVLGFVALFGMVLALICVTAQCGATGLAFFGMIFQDHFGQFCKILFLFASAAIVLVSTNYLEREKLPYGEFFSLLLFATVGMLLMATSADLIMTFLGLEVLSISTYVLAGFKEGEMKSTESALKYFLLGAFSSGFLLYGIAFVYGAAGSTKYLKIAQVIEASENYPPTLFLGLGLMVVGFGFKAALAPFHVWTPDVYEGAPVPITAHLAVGSKAAALVALVRVLYQVLPELSQHWQAILWVSAVLTMAIGNIGALAQTNIKRMLAYSSIAHAGYLLVGLTAHNRLGTQSILFYLVAYAFMTLGAFAVVQAIGREGEKYISIDDYSDLGYRYPFLSITLSVFLISLAGIPATGGFMGKLFLFAAAMQSEMYWLVVIAVIASAIGIYYYLRVIVFMYMGESKDEGTPIIVPTPVRIVIAIMVVGTFYLGIFPGTFLHLASEAVSF
ncbi:NADH-quinone oxidoreductase subunit N [Acidobacteria bacterium AH-259-A15]|nr:NADH-quinone oxidoreductase subunit N [Acidobacteria bacterium AH-259-A15]